MKHLLLTCIVSMAVIGSVIAQPGSPVSPASFNTDINNLNNAIKFKNLTGQNYSFNALNGMMSAQITFLDSFISSSVLKCKADDTTAKKDAWAANQEKAKALAELASANILLRQNVAGGLGFC